MPAITVSATTITGDAPKRNESMAITVAEPIAIQTNSTVRSWTSARSSIRLIARHCFRWPNARSVAAKIDANISPRRCLRFCFEFPFASPVCGAIRLRTQEPRIPARKKRHPNRTRAATAIAIASGPPGP